DVRARIAALSEMPEEWQKAIEVWGTTNRSKKERHEGATYPTRNDEYLFYQVLLGVWPLEKMNELAHELFTERMVTYMIKAAREAKVNTSWMQQDERYESALEHFVREVLRDREFLATFVPFQKKVARYGALNSLSQILLKFTAPGVPDLYQGNESWRFSLVDPDNRRPVEYRDLARMLDSLQRPPTAAFAQDLWRNWRDGRVKLWVTHRLLAHRHEHPELYRDGTYRALEASGPAAAHVVAFARTRGEQMVVTVAPRLMVTLSEGAESPLVGPEPWQETTIPLPAGTYLNRFTGEEVLSEGTVGLDELFASLPVAQLERRDEG
ncbi:MAG: malto-oligosyltrehalose synthase, partial [Chloroflexota bacterium]|nr:malto-oligosyltrehalose synthase [Chloroflexota bacterium]